jgi:ATP-dependent Clp protease ATP-binding subunit ClpA
MVFSNLVMQALQDETVGREYVVTALTRALTLAVAGARRRGGVLGTLLFIGPASTGKTYMARTLSRVLTGSERAIIYFNCQQLAQGDHLNSLHAQLSAQLQRNHIWPSEFRVVVFDEIDKATPAFHDDLAMAIDCGALTTSEGRFPLQNAFVVLICDLSRKKADQLVGRTIGFFLDGEPALEMPHRQSVALEEVDGRLGPRLVGRLDEIIVFERLTEQNIVTMLERRLCEMEKNLASSCIGFVLQQEAKTFLLNEGLVDLNHGARQIERVVRNYLEFPLADLMLSRRLVPGTTVRVGHVQSNRFLNFDVMIPCFNGVQQFSKAFSLESESGPSER